jgi:hypothetical protein
VAEGFEGPEPEFGVPALAPAEDHRTPNLRVLRSRFQLQETVAFNSALNAFNWNQGAVLVLDLDDEDVELDQDDTAWSGLVRLRGYTTLPRTLTLPAYRRLFAVEHRMSGGHALRVRAGPASIDLPAGTRALLWIEPDAGRIRTVLGSRLARLEFRTSFDGYAGGQEVGIWVAATRHAFRRGYADMGARCTVWPLAPVLFLLSAGDAAIGTLTLMPEPDASFLRIDTSTVLPPGRALHLTAPATVEPNIAGVDLAFLSEVIA